MINFFRGFDAGPSMRDFYTQQVKPEIRKTTTEAVYRNFLDWWERCSRNPGLRQLDSARQLTQKDLDRGELPPAQIVRQFREQLRRSINVDQKANADHTVNKHQRSLRAILRAAERCGVIIKTPRIEMLRIPRKRPRTAKLEQIDRIIEACPIARWPREVEGEPVNPCTYWKALVVFLFNTALRHSDFIRLRMSDIDWVEESVSIQIKKTGEHKKFCKMNDCVFEHLREIRGGGEREFLFGKAGSYKQRYAQWDRIQEHAGLAKPFFDFHDLRRTGGSETYSYSPAAAQELLGHANVDTTHEAYSDQSDHLSDVQGRRRQPQSFRGPSSLHSPTIKIG